MPSTASAVIRATAGAIMKPWPLNPHATNTPSATCAEDRLVVGRDVVDAVHEQRERDVLEARQQLLDAGADRRAPLLATRRGIAARAEVAREHAAVGELLRGERELGRDDERLEQTLADRVAEEEVAILGARPAGRPERREQRGVSAPAATTTTSAAPADDRRTARASISCTSRAERRARSRTPRRPTAAGRSSRRPRTRRRRRSSRRAARARARLPRRATRSATESLPRSAGARSPRAVERRAVCATKR